MHVKLINKKNGFEFTAVENLDFCKKNTFFINLNFFKNGEKNYKTRPGRPGIRSISGE